jgi:histidinol-phosphate/aromatic aminotransferase/cobyric acid decarboxylase-like protein
MLDLSQSLNPLALDAGAVVARHLEAIRLYPDDSAATRALARCIGVGEARVVLTNGGSEAISLVSADMGGHVDEPEFALHPRHGGPRWRSNPHSPSGLLAAPDERAGVWDEAFYPLATGRWTRGDADAVVVGSLTKLLACPGLRVGYVLAAPDVAARVRARRPQWAVNALAAAALPELLEAVDLPAWSHALRVLRADLVRVLGHHGLTARPSDANWVLVDAPGLRDRLAPQGVVVRDCSSFGLPGVVRIAVPSALGLERLDAALSSTEPPTAPEGRQLERTP